jgi:hypothetical protein
MSVSPLLRTGKRIDDWLELPLTAVTRAGPVNATVDNSSENHLLPTDGLRGTTGEGDPWFAAFERSFSRDCGLRFDPTKPQTP